MTNTVSAAATGLPVATTRRRALASLAGFGAALSLPKAVGAASLAAAHPDTVLIAHAGMVEEMIARSNAAFDRQYKLDDKVDGLKPPRPEKVEEGGTLPVQASKQHEDAVAAWEAACDALREETGYNAADELASDLYRALEDAVGDLTPMIPTTLAGLAAKARCAAALDPHRDFTLSDEEEKLFASIAYDVIAIGCAA